MNTFTDKETEVGIHWDEIWKELIPTSELGLKYKTELKPFLPGTEEQWNGEMETMSRLIDSESIASCKYILTELQSIEPILDLIYSGYPGTVSEWFMVKQFLFDSHALIKLLEKEWANAQHLLETLNFLLLKLNSGEQLQRPFTIDDLDDETLRVLRNHKLKCEAFLRIQLHRWEKMKKDELKFDWKSEPFFVSVHDIETNARLRQNPSIKKVTETPFEVGYALLPSEDIVRIELELAQAIDAIELREKQLLSQLQQHFSPYLSLLKALHHQIGEWDWRLTKVEWAKKVGAVRPQWSPNKIVVIHARHPFVARMTDMNNKPFVPVSMTLGQGVTTIVGPNMGGKSVALKTIAVSIMLFHYGLWIPAQAFSGYFFPGIVLVKGDREQTESGLSTFGAEMVRTSHALQNKKSLLLFDEVARGTNPDEGSRLAAALAAYMQEHAYVCLMVTHFASVLKVPGITCYRSKGLTEEGMKLLQNDFSGAIKTGIDYTIERVEDDDIPQQALLIAQALGLPAEIIERAKREENNG